MQDSSAPGSRSAKVSREIAGFSEWEPGAILETSPFSRVRYGKGFLQAQPVSWFESLTSYWVPLFVSLNATIEIRSVTPFLEFPSDLERVVPFEVDGDLAIIGWNRAALGGVTDAVVTGMSDIAGEIVVEYLERRLLWTLSRSWSGRKAIECSYLSDGFGDEVEIGGAIRIALTMRGTPGELWFGVGPKLLETLDGFSRKKAAEHLNTKSKSILPESGLLRVVLAELAVPPALLLDFLQPNAVIDLQTTSSAPVLVFLGDLLWATGTLTQYNGRFAVEIGEIDIDKRMYPESTTRLQIQIADVKMEGPALREHYQVGATLLTTTELHNHAELIVSGESIAEVLVGVGANSLSARVIVRGNGDDHGNKRQSE